MSWTFDQPDALWALLLLVPMGAMLWASRRRLSGARLAAAVGLRVALLLAIVLALAGLTRQHPVDALGVVFVMDRSASVHPEVQAEAEAFVREALEYQSDEDLAGIVAFGADAMVESEVREALEFAGVESLPSAHATDIEAGLRLATALLPADRARRIVLLSDGEQTTGDAVSQVLLTAGDDLEVATVSLRGRTGPEVLLEDLVVPPRVDEGNSFEVKVVARSERDTSGTLRLFRNEELLGSLPISLEAGRARVVPIRQEARTAGLYRYRATLEVEDEAGDTLAQNNEVVGTVQVEGKPQVLLVEGYPSQSGALAGVLRREGLAVDVVSPPEMPPNLAGLRKYAAVILSDAPAYQMSSVQMAAVQSFVRDLGRGLVMVGGDQSFGLGGFHGTPVEAALPVRMDIQDKTRFPKLAMVLAIDKSCSMGGGEGSKLAMAKEASIGTAELLSDRDMLGVIGFDGAASWVVPLLDMSNRAEIVKTIASLRPGGGTDIYSAAARGIKGLRATDASLRHLVILSDGMTTPGDYQNLFTEAFKEDHITVSSIAIGTDADTRTMRDFGNWGGGNYYLVTDAKSIPAIFARETVLASRSFLIEEPLVPTMAAPSDLLKGMSQSDFPTLGGMIATEPRPRATVALVSSEDDKLPVLAHWNYGLGRSVAFTSDAKARWSRAWLDDPSFVQFWTQVIRWTVGSGSDGSLLTRSEIRDGELYIIADAYDGEGEFRNFLTGEARVVSPDLTVRSVTMRQTAPGRYEGRTRVDQDGSWLSAVALSRDGTLVAQSVSEAVQPYSPEYRSRGGGEARMRELGSLGGGGEIADRAAVFARPEVSRRVPQAMWPFLVALAGVLWLLDIAARRLAPPRIGAMMPRVVTTGAPAARAERRRPAWVPPTPKNTSGSDEEQIDIIEEAVAPPVQSDIPEDSYAGRLLAARRSARKKMDQDP